MSDTPRTDVVDEQWRPFAHKPMSYVRAIEHARQLEREVAELLEERRKWSRTIDLLHADVIRALKGKT